MTSVALGVTPSAATIQVTHYLLHKLVYTYPACADQNLLLDICSSSWYSADNWPGGWRKPNFASWYPADDWPEGWGDPDAYFIGCQPLWAKRPNIGRWSTARNAQKAVFQPSADEAIIQPSADETNLEAPLPDTSATFSAQQEAQLKQVFFLYVGFLCQF